MRWSISCFLTFLLQLLAFDHVVSIAYDIAQFLDSALDYGKCFTVKVNLLIGKFGQSGGAAKELIPLLHGELEAYRKRMNDLEHRVGLNKSKAVVRVAIIKP
ncbi:hypothetical protein L596_023922 [Steinernema carpocapsae]|uniref:Uncharacterized protein n=1 Tax=Steinernema carpocapsae TaxID=34508 RepID=A0A4U5MFC6_STECR|nr:hypothetical protein L596_023922 [Steinernema carpocapsae]